MITSSVHGRDATRARGEVLRAVVAVSIALTILAPAFAQAPAATGGQLDASETLFDVLAAANAAGYDADLNLPTNSPVRALVRQEIAKENPASLPELKAYFRDQRPPSSSAELSQYVSFALLSAGPPDFKPAHPDLPAPPDADKLFELPPLLAQFYKDAHLDKLWKQVQPYYEQAIDQYTEPVSRTVLQANAYLRNPTSGYLGRRFQIFVDLMGAPNVVQTRSYVDNYYVVVTPQAELPIDQIRRAYLLYLLDPLSIKYAAELKKKSVLGDFAQEAPLLPELFKTNFNLMASESFIKAVDARITRKPAMVEEALKEGYVLTPAFYEQLPLYEKQDVSMRLYFPDMVDKIDVKHEQQRLEAVQFATERPQHEVRVTVPAPPPLSGAAKILDEAEQAYLKRDLDRAKAGYLRVLQEPDENSLHAKAYYGLARVAVLQRDPETGDRLFRKVLELGPDADTRSWSLLYLGRLADSQGDREHAENFYREALAVPGVPDAVREAAGKGLNQAFTKK
jgi:tetratricopeptide (TPR) repeat protein